MTQIRSTRWTRSVRSVSRPATRLVCLPHSGGSVDSFNALAAALPTDTELMVVQYLRPGRMEPAELALRLAADGARIAEELTQGDPSPCAADLALFGHGLGALLAYETARALERYVGCRPAAVFVSGAPVASGPHDLAPELPEDDAQLWSTLCDLGEVDPAIAENPGLRRLMLPPLRADVRTLRSWRPVPGAEPLSCPLRCYYTPGDPLAGEAGRVGWAAHTTGPYSAQVRPGGHFHLWSDTDALVRDISATVRRDVAVAC